MSENYVNQITSTGGTTYDIAEGMTTRIFRGTCTTAGNTSPKVVALDDATGYSLTPGVRIAVTFTYGNDISTPALRVNSTSSADQKDVAIPTSRTDKTTGNGTTYNTWGPYETVFFTYDGTYWIINGSGRAIYNAYALAASKGSGTVTSVGITNGGGLSISNSPVTGSGTITIGHSNSTITAKTTQAVYPIKFDTYGHITGSGSAVTIPSKTSDLTNDSGFITDSDIPEGASAYTGTISAVSTTAASGSSNAFARGDHVHNITSSTITSALGYTPYDSTNPNGYISSYTDEKLKWTASTSSNTYYPLQSTSTATTSTANTLNSVSFYQYYNTAGGYRRLILGNTTAYTSTGGAYGTIRLYGTGATYYGDLNPGTVGANSLTGNRTWTLPNATGTIALTSDIPTVPTITLNGSSTTSPSFYAPTGAGTSGYYLKSNGSGAPSWTAFPTIPSISLNGSSTTSPSFYAPTTAGTSGYYLKSTGSGAPSWTAFPNIPTISQTLTSGVEIAQVTVGSTTTKLYAPEGGGDTYTLPLAADGTRGGVQIGYSESGKNYAVKLSSEKMYVEVPWTDYMVQVSPYSGSGTRYPTLSGSATATGTTLNTGNNGSISFYQSTGTTIALSEARLNLGTATTYTSSNGYYGTIKLYGTGNYGGDLVPGDISQASSLTANRTWTLPNATGTLALTDDIPTITPSLSSGTAIATITQNGSTSTLYAPAGGGSSSAVLISEEYTFDFSFTAGTIGTRGYQGSETINKTGYVPVSVVITYVGSSANYMPIVFLGGTNLNTLYCNIYRSTTSAVSNSSVRVTVHYALEDGNAVSVNTYNGEVS